MNSRAPAFLVHWAVVAIALAITTWLVPGVSVSSVGALIVAALAIGFVNAVIKPILVLLTLPLTILTLGLFYLVVNGVSFWIAAGLVPGFHVRGLFSAMAGALALSIVSWLIGALVGSKS